MRLVIAAALGLIASGATAAPPPPPPPLPGDLPSEVGGYRTGWMHSEYRNWLRSRSNDYALAALMKAAPRRAEDSGGQKAFALLEGPKLSFLVSLGDGADHYAFHFVCPRAEAMPSPSQAAFRDYVARVRRSCTWQASRAAVRFREFEASIGEEQLRPDFSRLSELLRQAGIPNDGRATIPDAVFLAVGSAEPLFARATKLDAVTATRCRAITDFLAELDAQQLRVDIADVGTDRKRESPPIEPSSFRLEIPILQGGNGRGSVTVSDEGSGLASDSWRALDQTVGPCFASAAG